MRAAVLTSKHSVVIVIVVAVAVDRRGSSIRSTRSIIGSGSSGSDSSSHLSLFFCNTELSSSCNSGSRRASGVHGYVTPTIGTRLLVLQPHPQTIQMKDMTTRQLLAFLHGLLADQAVSSRCEFFSCGVIEASVQILRQLEISNERDEAVVEVVDRHPQFSNDVNREAIVHGKNAEEEDVGHQSKSMADKIQDHGQQAL